MPVWIWRAAHRLVREALIGLAVAEPTAMAYYYLSIGTRDSS
jgi:hypothetical protein